MKVQCTTGKERRVRRWEHEAGHRCDASCDSIAILKKYGGCADKRSNTPLGTIKAWMGATHFLTKTTRSREY